ncbi:MAG: hypothetical protein WA624_23980 [Methylocella sp.]
MRNPLSASAKVAPADATKNQTEKREHTMTDRKMTKPPPGAKFFEEVTRLRTINGQLPVALKNALFGLDPTVGAPDFEAIRGYTF